MKRLEIKKKIFSVESDFRREKTLLVSIIIGEERIELRETICETKNNRI